MRTVPLQDLCLEVIVSNFKWYCEVYCSTEDSCLKLKFEFLKKKFSFLILQKLNVVRGRIEPGCLDFLINKYLNVLDAEWLSPWPWETVCHRLAEIGTNLKEATFTYSEKTWKWEEVLCYLPNLRNITFEYHCRDEFLLCLSKFCKCVETLNIRNSYVSDDVLTHKNLHSLHATIKELIIGGTRVEDEGIAYILKNMPSLEKIDFINLPEVLYSMHKSGINASDKVKPYKLTHLNLLRVVDQTIFTNVFNIFTICASVCPHLKFLACPIFKERHLVLCSQLQQLEELHLECMEKDPLELNDLLTLNGRKLTSIKIDNFCVSLSILAQYCLKLISLEMDNVILQYNYNDSVPVFHNLEKVVVDHLDITEAVSCLLISAPNLKQLCFYYCDLRSSDIKIHILRCCEQCELNVLDFWDSHIEFELVRDVLLTCSTLQTLKLDDCDIIFDYDAMHELKTISTSLPNKPQICTNI